MRTNYRKWHFTINGNKWIAVRTHQNRGIKIKNLSGGRPLHVFKDSGAHWDVDNSPNINLSGYISTEKLYIEPSNRYRVPISGITTLVVWPPQPEIKSVSIATSGPYVYVHGDASGWLNVTRIYQS